MVQPLNWADDLAMMGLKLIYAIKRPPGKFINKGCLGTDDKFVSASLCQHTANRWFAWSLFHQSLVASFTNTLR